MTTISALPSAPSPSDSQSQFNTKAFALVAALSTFVTETNTVAGEINTNALAAATAETNAETAETNAEAAQAAAEAASNATKWVSGTTYAEGDVRWSPIDFLSYRRKTNGAGTTDPSLDGTNWAEITLKDYLDGLLAAKLESVSEDTSPQLGGELDCQAHSVGFTLQTATGDGTTTIDWRLGNIVFFTFGAMNETFTFTAPSKPCGLHLIMKQDAAGSRAAIFPTIYCANGTAITLSTAGNSIDVVSLVWTGSIYLVMAANGFAIPA
jgi:hypothetical protein